MSGRWPAAAAALALVASPAAAYVRSATPSGLCLWWSTRAVHYEMNDFTVNGASQVCGAPPVDASFQKHVTDSFATWGAAATSSGPCTDLSPVFDGPTPSTATGLDCRNLVVFRRGSCSGLVPASDPCRLWDVNQGSTVNCADAYNCWDTGDPFHEDSRIIALTTVSYVDRTGEIVDADMELNAWAGAGTSSPPGYYFTCVDPPASTCTSPGQPNCIDVDVQNTVTHEAGHVFGLAHTQSQYCVPVAPVDGAATMCANASLGETAKRTLAPDDVNGICSIYPAGAPTNVCFGSGQVEPRPSSTCTGESCGCGTAGAEGWLALVALLPWRRRCRLGPRTPSRGEDERRRARPGRGATQRTTAPA